MAAVKLLMVLTENHTLVDPRDVRGLVRMAVEAEQAGIDCVQVSEHVVLGRSAGARGVMGNRRDYAAPGNQDPATPWPNNLVTLAAIAQATSALRLLAGAVIAPLHHPLTLAKQLGTLDLLSEGRLVVLPTVSWHRDEYEALNVPFERRGHILDEQLEILAKCWGPQPVMHHGEFFSFDDVWVEPGSFHPTGPVMWFGGQGMHPPLVRRIVLYGSGLDPFGTLSDDDLSLLAAAMREGGRDLAELELVGGIRGRFRSEDDVADLDEAWADVPRQLEQGFTTISFKPSMFVREVSDVGPLCRELVGKARALAS